MSKLASECVANILNDWYIAIKQQDTESAERYFEKIKPLFDEMEEDQEVLMYYSLLEERHKMLLFQVKGEELPSHSYFNENHAEEIKKTDHMIEYYFFLFEALYESHKRNFEKAITLFKIAEKKLKDIPDCIERAEFYSKVASMYMMLRQSLISLNYINDSVQIYRENEGYKRKLATSLMIVGQNYTDLGLYEKAEESFLEAIRISRVLQDSLFTALIHHNLSITYSAANRSQDCINALKKAIRNKDWRDSVYYINSLYMFLKELYKIGDVNKIPYYCKKTKEYFKRKENKVYEAKINIIYGLLQQDQRKSIETCRGGISYLYEVNDLDSVFDLSLVISEHCEKHGLYKEALEFSRHAILAEKKMRHLEGL
ncbi:MULTISPECIES: tetratricopeptide repeat protein [Bacillus amyloliquefaciens group]|uniref:response regulator aspartate phosphatase n=1 Tax=Bacillus amyloliquefaciens group TaxID=1938374 RepID=UPI000B600E0E|nr:tetratricopeptide repeat protein [Bacillus velezensis]ASB66535.1 Response regulator aspartate phosphatase [Bacillus velezensis]QAV93292.1 tetratricopeptide repeat protein [Bacillus velezensis]QAW25755.1 tetratricopeptide repeat protein [Bacillus velezensis]QAW50976.1 tetratricopeptide repeat protein [Bacillus velezensis]UBM53989.1 tetratricopeptide repeat protein [Bacillus velezensis]